MPKSVDSIIDPSANGRDEALTANGRDLSLKAAEAYSSRVAEALRLEAEGLQA